MKTFPLFLLVAASIVSGCASRGGAMAPGKVASPEIFSEKEYALFETDTRKVYVPKNQLSTGEIPALAEYRTRSFEDGIEVLSAPSDLPAKPTIRSGAGAGQSWLIP